MLTILFIQGFALLLQVVSAVLALRLILITGKYIAWLLLATGITVIIIRRGIAYARLLVTPLEQPVTLDRFVESVLLLTISLLFVLGIAAIEPLFLEYQRAQREIQTTNRILRMLSSVNQALIRAQHERMLTDTICHLAVDQGGYAFAWIGVPQEDARRTVYPVSTAGQERGYLSAALISWADNAWGREPSGQAIRTERLTAVRDIAAEPSDNHWRAAALAAGYRAAVALPLMGDGQTLGALTLYCMLPVDLTDEEVRLLTEMAEDVAYGLTALRTREARQRAEQALQESETQYRTIVETAQEGIWVLDRHLMTTYANKRMAEMLGYPLTEMLGRSLYDFVAPDMRAEMERQMEQRKLGGKEIYEFRFRRQDGSDLWTLVSASPYLDEQGQFLGSFGMLTDITRRHTLEAYQQEFAYKTIEAATDGKLILRERDEILQLAGPSVGSWEIVRADDLETIRHSAAEIAVAAGMDEDRVDDFMLCISEAATNALKHAGKGTASLHHAGKALLAVISDRGPGIPAINLPEVALKRGYTTGGSLGMGYKAMISLADHVYLATNPEGTTVGIAMAPQAPSMPSVTEALPDLWQDELPIDRLSGRG
ncbi:MAG: PAS domain S-box protein [Armatimonadota bacterium]